MLTEVTYPQTLRSRYTRITRKARASWLRFARGDLPPIIDSVRAPWRARQAAFFEILHEAGDYLQTGAERSLVGVQRQLERIQLRDRKRKAIKRRKLPEPTEPPVTPLTP